MWQVLNEYDEGQMFLSPRTLELEDEMAKDAEEKERNRGKVTFLLVDYAEVLQVTCLLMAWVTLRSLFRVCSTERGPLRT